jgi:hypothetical protein
LQSATFEPTFDTFCVIGISFRLKAQGYDEAKSVQLQQNLRERMSAMPGVVSVALDSASPLSFLPPMSLCWLTDGFTVPSAASSCHAISTGYFETLGVPIVRGRAFLAPIVKAPSRSPSSIRDGAPLARPGAIGNASTP